MILISYDLFQESMIYQQDVLIWSCSGIVQFVPLTAIIRHLADAFIQSDLQEVQGHSPRGK